MSKSDSSKEEQVLGARLHREAAEFRPDFSESLHRRLCSTVRRCEVAKACADPIPSSGRRLGYGLATAMIAVGVLIAAVIVRHVVTNDGSNEQAPLAGSADRTTELEIAGALAGLTSHEIGVLAKSTVAQQSWIYLDENAKRAYEALNNRVPLDAVASLAFSDPSTDSRWQSTDR